MESSERITGICVALAAICGVALVCSPTLRLAVENETIALFNAVIMIFITLGSVAVFAWIVAQLCRVVWSLSHRSDSWFAKIESQLNVIGNAFTPVDNRLSRIEYEVTQLREKLEELENKVSPVAETPEVEDSAETVLENVMDEFTEVDYE